MRRTHQPGRPYQPDRGDFVFLNFTPQAGTEQAGHRPGLVLSPQRYNIGSGLCLVCPITNQVKGSPFEVTLPAGAAVTGAVLTDHLRSVDWLSRNMEFRGKATDTLLAEVLNKIAPLLFPD